MIDRKDLGGWLDGAPVDPEYVRGADLGLPAAGPGSVPGIGRRFGSYVIDWSLCAVASIALRDGSLQLVWPLYTVMCILLLSLFGATIGQFVLGMRVIPVARRWPMVLRATVRTLLLLLLLPTMIWNRDGQPLQDVAAGTAVVRR